MIGKIILIPCSYMMDALDVMERQNDIGKTRADRIIIGVGKDGNNSEINDLQFVAVATSEDIFNQVVADFKASLPEVYVQDKQISRK